MKIYLMIMLSDMCIYLILTQLHFVSLS